MSMQLEEIMNSFNKYINIYVGLLIPENNNYDEAYLLSRIGDIALKNRIYSNELCNIIIEHLNKDEIQYKIKLFNIIDSLFKSVGKDYINKICNHLFVSFKQCFTRSDFNERILLFKIFYTWKYLVPKTVLDNIGNALKLDEFKKTFIKNYPGKIEKYDDYNNKMRLKIESMNNDKEIMNNNNINISKKNNTQNIPKKIISEKKYKEDIYQNDINNNLNYPINLSLNKPKKKKTAILSKKRKSSQDKSLEGNLSTNKVKKISNPLNNNNLINNNVNNTSLEASNIINMSISNNNSNNNNNNGNDLFINLNNLNNIPLSLLLNSGINLSALTNSLSNLNNINTISSSQNNIPIRPQNQQQQQQLIQNILLNMITNKNTLFNSNQNQVQPSIIEYKIYQFLTLTTTKLNINLRFFGSLAKYYNESLQERDNIDIKCKFEDIYNNEAYKLIRQKIDNKLFKDIKKNVCAICGFRTLFYNNLTEHLDIHFNINYLQMEGKNLFRKIGHNRNNWINGDNSKNYKDKVGYTLGNLLYYKNMMNNNFVKINKEQEEDNEEFMIPIYDDNKEKCYYCGDEFKKIFSTKYNYWFYNKVIPLIEEKNKYLIHQNCYDEMIKKI
jgi:hypothetical protein